MESEVKRKRHQVLKILIIWVAILLFSVLIISHQQRSDPISMKLFPEVAREGEPLIVSFTLTNPQIVGTEYEYELYANGESVLNGISELPPLSSKKFKYTYRNPLNLGEQANFMVSAASPTQTYRKTLASPPYPPQTMTSFVSFASFSTSVMSTMTTTGYYDDSFQSDKFNVGLLVSIVLICLLIFLELTEPLIGKGNIYGRLRDRYSKLATILFVIFIAMVFTKVMVVVGG
ncbi:hypothetical protein C5S53_08195 [Methanophagales archaeon]|nr:hypothetical protein C5S53_08195 [Methanophagales archaeon]